VNAALREVKTKKKQLGSYSAELHAERGRKECMVDANQKRKKKRPGTPAAPPHFFFDLQWVAFY